MSLFGQELRKIWRPGLLAGIILLGLIYYYMFPSFYIRHFSNGPLAQEQVDLSAGWVARYGPTLEPEERAEIDSQLADEIAEFNRQLGDFPEAAVAGITDYESFRAADQTDENVQLMWDIRDGTNYYTIESILQMMELCDLRRNYFGEPGFFEYYTSKEQARMLAAESWPHSLLPRSVMDSTNSYLKYLAQWTAFSVILLLSPTLVRDRLRRMRPIQWSSRRGRRVLHTQLAAGLVSALLLSVANTVIYAIPFLAQGPLAFRDCPLGHSVWDTGIAWFNWTYGQYLAILTGMVLALGLGIGAVTLFLSRFSDSYMSMLLKAFPLLVAMGGFFATWVMNYTFFFHPAWDYAEFFVSRGAEAVCVVVLLLVGAALTGWSCIRQRRSEC